MLMRLYGFKDEHFYSYNLNNENFSSVSLFVYILKRVAFTIYCALVKYSVSGLANRKTENI